MLVLLTLRLSRLRSLFGHWLVFITVLASRLLLGSLVLHACPCMLLALSPLRLVFLLLLLYALLILFPLWFLCFAVCFCLLSLSSVFLAAFGQYLFYYFPPELGHLTTFWVMPHYGVAGVIFGFFINAVTKTPRTWGLPISLYAMGLCVTALG